MINYAYSRSLALLICCCLLLTREGRDIIFRNASANKFISRIGRFSFSQRLVKRLTPTYGQSSDVDRLNFFAMRVLKRILKRHIEIAISINGVIVLGELRQLKQQAMIVMAHTGFPAIHHVIAKAGIFEDLYLLASDEVGARKHLDRSGLSHLSRIRIIKNDKSCLAVLAKKLCGSGAAFCSIDYRTSGSLHANMINLGIFKFAKRRDLSVCFAKLISPKSGEFVVVLEAADLSKLPHEIADDFVKFSQPEKVLHISLCSRYASELT